MERSQLLLCKKCDSGRTIKKGFRNTKRGKVQLFWCKDCKSRFTPNHGFEKKQFDDEIITDTMQIYNQGNSVRDIANHFEMKGINVNPSTIYRWVSEYGKESCVYLDSIIPRVGKWYRADELYLKISGQQRHLYSSMDDDTRYWITHELADSKYMHNTDQFLHQTLEQTGKRPTNFITDGLPAYEKSSKRVFGKETRHIKHIHLTGKRSRDNNNKMERLNGTIRDREVAFRGLKNDDTNLIDGFRTFYNCTKKHEGLGGKTPAEEALILIDGPNKWKTIIQNASLYKRSF